MSSDRHTLGRAYSVMFDALADHVSVSAGLDVETAQSGAFKAYSVLRALGIPETEIKVMGAAALRDAWTMRTELHSIMPDDFDVPS